MGTNTNLPILLLVEDCDDDAYFFTRTLETSGATCSFHHVTDGARAIDFLENASRSEEPSLPQIIFLDLKMPTVNGFEVLDWMNKQTFSSQIQVIVLSGSEYEEDKQRAEKLGAAAYLVKPVKVSDLHRFLQHVCPPEMGAQR
jgi:CheY-like chemotaxis protein